MTLMVRKMNQYTVFNSRHFAAFRMNMLCQRESKYLHSSLPMIMDPEL